jgi:uncharacterized protein YjiS (DUF1127 family)
MLELRAHPPTLLKKVAVMLMRTVLEPEARPARPARFTRALRFTADLVIRVEAYFECRRQLKELMALDDRMLRDIGLNRAEVMRIASDRCSPPGPRRDGREPSASIQTEASAGVWKS